MDPELSQKLLSVFEESMKGKWRFSILNDPWYYKEDIQRAVNAVGEAALRHVQEALSK